MKTVIDWPEVYRTMARSPSRRTRAYEARLVLEGGQHEDQAGVEDVRPVDVGPAVEPRVVRSVTLLSLMPPLSSPGSRSRLGPGVRSLELRAAPEPADELRLERVVVRLAAVAPDGDWSRRRRRRAAPRRMSALPATGRSPGDRDAVPVDVPRAYLVHVVEVELVHPRCPRSSARASCSGRARARPSGSTSRSSGSRRSGRRSGAPAATPKQPSRALLSRFRQPLAVSPKGGLFGKLRSGLSRSRR